MWFAFGLVTVVAAGAVTAWRRRASDWEGTRVGTYMHRITRGKSKAIESVRIGVQTRSTLDFECKPEGDLDRYFKHHGLTREYQTGQRAFDDALYVVSDDPRVAAALRTDPGLAADMLALYDAGRPRFAFDRVTCRDGRLWVDYSASGKPERADDLLAACVPPLESLAAALPTGAAGNRGDRLLLRSVVVLAASSGLAISGALQLLRIYLDDAFTVDSGQLLPFTAFFGGLLLLLMCLLTLKLLYRTSRFHLVLTEVLLVGAFGAFATAYAELRDFNMEFDPSGAQELSATVVDKRVRHGRRSRRTYYVTVTDWNGSGAPVERRVPRNLHDALLPGQVIKVRQHEGRLGARWVEDLYDSNF